MISGKNDKVMFDIEWNLLIDNRQPIAVSDIYLFDQISFRSKSKEQLNEASRLLTVTMAIELDKVFGGDVVDIIESQFWPTRVDHVGSESTF